MSMCDQSWIDLGFELLEEAFGSAAIQQVRFFRNENDSFEVAIEPEADNVPSGEPELSRAELFEYLPAGSEWTHAEGWRSFFAKEVLTDRLWVVGCVAVRRHATRGAYPEALVLTLSELTHVRDGIASLANEISRNQHVPEQLIGTRGLVRVDSKRPVGHLHWEVNLLRTVWQSLEDNTEPIRYFRTAVLSEHDKKEHSKREVFGFGNRDEKLALIVPKLLPLKGFDRLKGHILQLKRVMEHSRSSGRHETVDANEDQANNQHPTGPKKETENEESSLRPNEDSIDSPEPLSSSTDEEDIP